MKEFINKTLSLTNIRKKCEAPEPSKNALKRCTKGLHLRNKENACVVCGKQKLKRAL